MVSFQTVPQEVPVNSCDVSLLGLSVSPSIMANFKAFDGHGISFLESSQNSGASGGSAAIHLFSLAGVEKAFLETTVSTETPVKATPVRTEERVKLHP